MKRRTEMIIAEAVETVESSHLLEWLLVITTVALTIPTALGAWISWKLYKVDSEKTKEIANNAIDSIESVAKVAITHEDRVRELKAVSRKRKH
jgi:hypothetical protein